jgi:hypothetical protein
MDISTLHNKQVFKRENKTQTSGIHREVWEANDKLTLLNLNLDDLPKN